MNTNSPIASIRNLVPTILTATLLLVSCDQPDEWALAPEIAPVKTSQEVSQGLHFVESHYLGEGTLDDSQGILAASGTGKLAVSEPAICRITVFEITGGPQIYQVGKCGGGPQEYASL